MDKKRLLRYLRIKRALDICLSGTALLLFTPLCIAIGIAVKLDSKGPIIFEQDRLTKDGRVFRMYKFRSMIVNAENMGTGLFNYEHDPRVTRMGRFLRNTSLDELPQLVNVLRGDISIVGPRPSVVGELGDYETLNRKYKSRFKVKGGITGLAQVKGRNNISWDEKVMFDNQYIKAFMKYGVRVDIQIIGKTIVKVFQKADICERRVREDISDIESAAMTEEEIIRAAHAPD